MHNFRVRTSTQRYNPLQFNGFNEVSFRRFASPSDRWNPRDSRVYCADTSFSTVFSTSWEAGIATFTAAAACRLVGRA